MDDTLVNWRSHPRLWYLGRMQLAAAVAIARVLGIENPRLTVGQLDDWYARLGPWAGSGATSEEALEGLRGQVMKAAHEGVERRQADATTLADLVGQL